MNSENQTRERLLKAAKEEFMEKGYTSASLRNICRKARVTTGALYFFFKDKEDLFASLVGEPLENILGLMKEHYASEMKELTKADLLADLSANFEEDKTAAQQIVEYMYHYHDEFVLLLMKSQGSKYENCTDEFVTISEEHYRILADKLSEVFHTKKLDDYIIHWMVHIQTFSFAQLITHGLSREEAVSHIKTIVDYLTSGWMGVYKEG